MSTKVFLSWSGEKSHKIAQHLQRGLRGLSDDLRVVLSDDLSPGRKWKPGLRQELVDSDAAILCLTSANKESHWVSYELGVFELDDDGDDRPAIPYLVDFRPSELTEPIASLEAREADWKGTLEVFRTIGELAELESTHVHDYFSDQCAPSLMPEIERLKQKPDTDRSLRIADAYFLGHDYRLALCDLSDDVDYVSIVNDLRQCAWHAERLGLDVKEVAQKGWGILDRLRKQVESADGDDWLARPEGRAEAIRRLRKLGNELSVAMKSWQEDYVTHPPSNDLYDQVADARDDI